MVKYSQNLLPHAKQYTTYALKTASKEAIQKASEVTGNFIANKSADKITKVSKSPPQNSSETVKSETEKWYLIEKYPKKDIYLQKIDME